MIDVATRAGADGKLHGDADFERVKDVASLLLPVPKGVGPVTVALMENVVLGRAIFAGSVKAGI